MSELGHNYRIRKFYVRLNPFLSVKARSQRIQWIMRDDSLFQRGVPFFFEPWINPDDFYTRNGEPYRPTRRQVVYRFLREFWDWAIRALRAKMSMQRRRRMKAEDQSLDELYAELEEWKPLDDAKRRDVQLAVQQGWRVAWTSWGPAWYHHDEEIEALNSKLTEVWTGYWVFDTLVRWQDRTDDAHRIFGVRDGKLTLTYSPGTEWAPSKNR